MDKKGCTAEQKLKFVRAAEKQLVIYNAALKKYDDLYSKYIGKELSIGKEKAAKAKLPTDKREKLQNAFAALTDEYSKYCVVDRKDKEASVARHITVADLPPEPKTKPMGTTRKKNESLKSFRVRTLKTFYKKRCKSTLKSCWVGSIKQLDDVLKGEDYSAWETGERGIVCGYCPSPEASDDVWIRWGEYMGFRFDLNGTKKKGTITVVKEEVKKAVKPKPVPKKVVEPKVVEKPVKKTVKKVVPAKKDGKKTTLNYAQLNKLIENGFVNIKIGGKTRKIKSKDINNKGQVK